MEQSFLDFKAQNPEWEPSAGTGAGYLSTVMSHKMGRSSLGRSNLINVDDTSMLRSRVCIYLTLMCFLETVVC